MTEPVETRPATADHRRTDHCNADGVHPSASPRATVASLVDTPKRADKYRYWSSWSYDYPSISSVLIVTGVSVVTAIVMEPPPAIGISIMLGPPLLWMALLSFLSALGPIPRPTRAKKPPSKLAATKAPAKARFSHFSSHQPAGLPAGWWVSRNGREITVPGEGVYVAENDLEIDFRREPGFAADTTPVLFVVTSPGPRHFEARYVSIDADLDRVSVTDTMPDQPRAALPAPAATPAPAPTADPQAISTWDAALVAHDAVREAWGAIASDALSALSHSSLLDVTQPRTAAFIEALGSASDLRAVLGETEPSRDDVVAFIGAARRARDTWAAALTYSRHIKTTWLPTAEANLARRASALLSTAADETATLPERAAAARKAADLLTRVHSFVLPETAVAAIEAQTRLALAAPSDRDETVDA